MEYVYAALLLHQAGKTVDEQGIKKVVEALGVPADESKVKTLLASLQGVDIEKAISEAGSMAVAHSAPEKAEAKPEQKEEKHEAAAEGLAALFG